MSRRGAVPVIMYHRVGPEIEDWNWSNSLTVPAHTFEDHLHWLRKSRYYTASLEELHAHMLGKKPLPERSVVLTFDDGYLDNWTYVVPLLEKYGCKAAIAVVPEFVDPRDVVRPTMKDVWAGRNAEADLELRAFVSWPELRTAVGNGTLSIVSHSLTHTWFATGPRIVDFHHPGDGHYWLDWNQAPEGKPFYLREPNRSSVPWGTPVYEHARALEMTRYFPDEREAAHACAFVASEGSESFFNRPRWRETLDGVIDAWRKSAVLADGYETEQARRERYRSELADSRSVLEEKTGSKVAHFLWPGQVFNEESMRAAREVYDSLDASNGAARMQCFNQPGEEAGLFRRTGVPDIADNGRLYYPGGRYLVRCLDEFRGAPLARRLRQAMKLAYLIVPGARKRS